MERIFTRCPACHCDTLTINAGHLLCTWIDCPNPTLIDRMGDVQPDPVAFADANLDGRTVKIHDTFTIHLTGDRSISVSKIAGEDGRCVRITRKANDGQESELIFGLHHDAFVALTSALNLSLPR